ncbi:MAG TPA: PilZ domain-containing protein [Thermoanaerobaculia bacterium]|nr:PilZ domain-containing protein [Thermoanaerobaculia bacterium]
MQLWNVCEFEMSKDRRKLERYPTQSIPVQLSEVDGELIDLSLEGAAIVHRSPIRSGRTCTLVFPSYGGIYIPCQILRSIVQVRRGRRGPEYVFRSAISFLPMTADRREPLHEFVEIQAVRSRRMEATG